jgi:hypothetical protein
MYWDSGHVLTYELFPNSPLQTDAAKSAAAVSFAVRRLPLTRASGQEPVRTAPVLHQDQGQSVSRMES